MRRATFTDPFELDNTAAQLSSTQKAQLHQILIRLECCHNADACWKAAAPR